MSSRNGKKQDKKEKAYLSIGYEITFVKEEWQHFLKEILFCRSAYYCSPALEITSCRSPEGVDANWTQVAIEKKRSHIRRLWRKNEFIQQYITTQVWFGQDHISPISFLYFLFRDVFRGNVNQHGRANQWGRFNIRGVTRDGGFNDSLLIGNSRGC